MARPQAATSLTSIDMLARVVAFDTTSHKSNLDLIGFVRAGLEAHEVPYRLSFDPTGQKANLHAHDRTGAAGGACLGRPRGHGAHRGQTRTEDPYTLRRQDGRLIERGTCDMKGFVAAVLAAVPGIKARKPTRPVHLLLTCDEEVGYHGARRLIEDLDDFRPAARHLRGRRGVQHGADLYREGPADLPGWRARSRGAFQCGPPKGQRRACGGRGHHLAGRRVPPPRRASAAWYSWLKATMMLIHSKARKQATAASSGSSGMVERRSRLLRIFCPRVPFSDAIAARGTYARRHHPWRPPNLVQWCVACGAASACCICAASACSSWSSPDRDCPGPAQFSLHDRALTIVPCRPVDRRCG